MTDIHYKNKSWIFIETAHWKSNVFLRNIHQSPFILVQQQYDHTIDMICNVINGQEWMSCDKMETAKSIIKWKLFDPAWKFFDDLIKLVIMCFGQQRFIKILICSSIIQCPKCRNFYRLYCMRNGYWYWYCSWCNNEFDFSLSTHVQVLLKHHWL